MFIRLRDGLKINIDISITPAAEYYLEDHFETLLASDSLLEVFLRWLKFVTSTLRKAKHF